MIDASEARKIAGLTLDEKIESLGETIKNRAKGKHRSCKTGYHHKKDEDLWASGGYNRSSDWRTAKKKLEKLGYTVTFVSTNIKLPLYMYTLVEW